MVGPEVLHIKAGIDIRALPTQRFLSLKKFDICEVQAKDLRPGDYIAYPRKMETDGKPRTLPAIKPKRFCRLTARGSRLVRSRLQDNGITSRRLAKATRHDERSLRRIINERLPSERETFQRIAALTGLGNMLLQECVPHYSHKWRRLRVPSDLTPDIAQTLGYILGDGRVSRRNICLRDQRLSILNVYRRIFSTAFGINCNTRPVTGKRCFELNVNSVDIAALFRLLIDEWKDVIPTLTARCVASFIRGFADAEGSVTRSLEIAQKDRATLEMLQLLLLRFGIKSTIRPANACHMLRIAEGTSLANFRREIGLSAPDKARKLTSEVARRTRIGADLIPIKGQALWNLAISAGLKPSKYIKHRETSAITRRSLATFIDAIKRNAPDRKALPDTAMDIRRLEKLIASPLGWDRARSITHEKADAHDHHITVAQYAKVFPNA